MIEKLDPNDSQSHRAGVQLDKLNELIDAYNNHIHYARELQFPTHIPDDPNVYNRE